MQTCPDCIQLIQQNQCTACGWSIDYSEGLPVWLSTADKNNEMFANYKSNYEIIGNDDLANSIQPAGYLEIQTDYLKSYLGDLTGLNICELGVGQGLLMERIIEDDIKHYTGIDICASYLKKYPTSEKTSFVIANAENIPYKSEFDLIVASDILEHVINVGDFLFTANQALVSGGKFIVRVPFLEDISMYSIKRGCKYDLVHLRNFSQNSLNIILEGSGFVVNKFYYDGFLFSNRRLFRAGAFGSLAQKYLQPLVPNDHLPFKINGSLGRLLIKPNEITAVCTKVREL